MDDGLPLLLILFVFGFLSCLLGSEEERRSETQRHLEREYEGWATTRSQRTYPPSNPRNNHDRSKRMYATTGEAQRTIQRMKMQGVPGSDRLIVYYNEETMGALVTCFHFPQQHYTRD